MIHHHLDLMIQRGTPVWGRGRKQQGHTTGGAKRCALEGCTRARVGVRWPGGKLTWPCTKGMLWDEQEKTWEIE
jgi:hypothetical protein